MADVYMKQRLIRSYNNAYGRCYKFTPTNLAYADRVLSCENDVPTVLAYWSYVKRQPGKYGSFHYDFVNDCAEFTRFHESFMRDRPDMHPQETPATATKTVEVTQMDKNTEAGIAALGQVLSGIVQNLSMDDIKTAVSKELKDETLKYIQDTYGPVEKRTTVVLNGKKTDIKGVVHEKFDQVLNYVARDIPVFLTGPAGSGKNVLCKQIADCLGLPFYFSNAVTQEYKVLGFTDANGVYQETQFYKAFKNGGLFMLDEIDASNPDVLNTLNAAIANRYQDFPAPIGFVEAHPNFRWVAAGNTYGTGADYVYVGRTQLDGATLDRFGVVRMNYDPRIEEAVSLGKTELLNFCRKFRSACEKAGIKTIVSYRSIGRMAQLDGVIDTKELVQSFLTKGMEKGDIQVIRGELSGFGEFSKAIEALAR